MKKTNITIDLISLVLIVGIFYWTNYLTIHNYIVECFTDMNITVNTNTTELSQTVRQPINTRYSCKNMCGPLARCSITGEQCQSDQDCYGCKPMFSNPEQLKITEDVPGYNDSGKLGQSGLLYSQLTADSLTRNAGEIQHNQLKPPPKAQLGVDTWRIGFDEGLKYYLDRHTYVNNENLFQNVNMPNYPERYTATGEFLERGPIPANSFQL
jgi:hypothetical protein